MVDRVTLAKLTGIPDAEMLMRIKDKVVETWTTFETAFPTHDLGQPPKLKFDLKGHTAGRAYSKSNLVRLNIDLLYDSAHTDEIVDVTLPHEIAHIVTRKVYGSKRDGVKSHGWEWQNCMRVLGLPPTRCHDMNTTAARKRKPMPRPFRYTCGCPGKVFKLTKILERRIQQGQVRYCRECGFDLRKEA